MPDGLLETINHSIVRWAKKQSVAIPPPEPIETPTPIYISHRTRGIILFVLLVLFVLLARALPNVIGTVFIGATLALILSFPVRFLQRYISRGKAVLVVTLGMVATAAIMLVLLIPFVSNEIEQFVTNMPETAERITEFIENTLANLQRRGVISERPEQIVQDLQNTLLTAVQERASSLLDNLVASLGRSFSILLTTFGVIFVAIYLLVDIPKFRKSYVRMWAPAYRADAIVLWDTIGFSLSQYLGALAVSLVLQGVLAWIGLTLLGVPYALFLGIVVSVTAILPFVGAWISAIPAIAVAFTISWKVAIAVAVLYVLINQIEGNLITPKLQGNAVRVHPILIFFGVIGGTQIFGLVGAIMAVPVIAVIRVVSEFFWLRLRVAEDRPTLLSAMRYDRTEERIDNQSDMAKDMDDEEVTAEEVEEAVEPDEESDEDDDITRLI